LSSIGRNQWCGKPTELGITAVRDNLILSADEPGRHAEAPEKGRIQSRILRPE
jgi:hypothetical protein